MSPLHIHPVRTILLAAIGTLLLALAALLLITVWDQDTNDRPAAGCYYEEVQCIRAPCEPVRVCPSPDDSADAPVRYRNKTYGFEIPLLASWSGYRVQIEPYHGTDVATGEQQNGIGTLITLHHPLDGQPEDRADMPVMVFEHRVWERIMSGGISLGAAPIPPTELGRNARYVFALPARYNYDFKPGWEDVDKVIHVLRVLTN